VADSVATLAAVDPKTLKITKVLNWSGPNKPNVKLNFGIPWWMTQHQTGNRADAASAEMHKNFVINGGGSDGVSFHLTVDHLEAYQMMELDRPAYHASDGMDDWTNDIGGWGSIAMELCVNYDNVDNPQKYLMAKQNAVALWVAVLTGDPRLEFGTGGSHRFNADRLAPHNRWAWDRKWCPSQLLNEGNMMPWSGDGPLKEAVKYRLGGMVPVDPATGYPAGMDKGVAEELFGPEFNPNGPLSKKWLARGLGTGLWPRYLGSKVFDDRKYFTFSDGWTLWRVGTGPITELK
jgi:hypothetical protein